MAKKKITDIEIAKLMLDPKRNKILSLASKEPTTVKQMAEQMDELPSRLYYHVKKLEDAGFLELVETKQQGNLIEKYYKTSATATNFYELDEQMAMENSSYLVQRMHSLVQSGLNLIQHGMETGRHEENAGVNIAFQALAFDEWKKVRENIGLALSKDSEEALEPETNEASDEGVTELQGKKDDYVFVVLTYRLKDAEELVRLQNESQAD